MDDSTKQALCWAGAGVGAYFLLKAAVRQITAYSFRDRTVLLTGGSRGLGLVMARQLAQEGARVALCARDEQELERAQIDVLSYGNEVMTSVCDVTKPDQVRETMEEVRQTFGPIDVLINNAGIIQVGPVETMTREDYAKEMDVHFWGPLNMIEAVRPEMQRRGAGRIVNISSIGGRIAAPHLLPYCASKFALVGLSEGLNVELAKYGIHVTTVCPGLMRVGSARQAWFKGRHREEYTWFNHASSFPLGTTSAEHAARKILNACRYGKAELTFTVPARFGVCAKALAPELTAQVLQWTNRALPKPGGIGTDQAKGEDSKSAWSPSLATTLGEKAAMRNNELQPT